MFLWRYFLTSVGLLIFGSALGCCAVATAGYLLSLLAKKIILARASTWILTAGFFLLSLSLIGAAVNSGGWTGFGSRHILSVYAWVIAGIYLGLQFKTKTRLLGAFISPFILLFLITAAGAGADRNLVPPQWQGWFTTTHLAAAIAGEALFVLSSAAGAMFMIQNSLLKHKKMGSLGRLLPSLSDLDRINHLGLLWGFPLLTLGIIGGALWAASTWGSLWAFDPKVIWSFAIWVIYGFLLHQRLAIGWKGLRMAAWSCAVFVLFLLSALVIRFCFSTVHNFI
jgi:ABC-type transport system involved in cytochrome c biogenesis permease subunit